VYSPPDVEMVSETEDGSGIRIVAMPPASIETIALRTVRLSNLSAVGVARRLAPRIVTAARRFVQMIKMSTSARRDRRDFNVLSSSSRLNS
jgi:hypothetical protein